MIVLIFANGSLNRSTELTALLRQAEFVIAADGGSIHCEKLGITPDILLGDLDSVDPKILAAYRQQGIPIQSHPPRKDATDLELALDLAMAKGARTIWLVGALGGRWDMSLANIMLAARDKYKDCELFLQGQDCSMQILHPGREHTINGRPDQKVSILPLKSDAHGVTLKGFEYPLKNHSINFGSSLGVSNIMTGDQATVQHTEGILLCVLFRENII